MEEQKLVIGEVKKHLREGTDIKLLTQCKGC